ncbi:hypothetical protein FQZ97_1247230 [compost metagenome]
MATTEPAICSLQSFSAAADRVLPISAASSGVRGSRSVQITSLFAGRRARVTPRATISASQRIGAPFFRAPRAAVTKSGENTNCFDASTRPQACTMRTARSASSSEKAERSASARMMAKERS